MSRAGATATLMFLSAFAAACCTPLATSNTVRATGDPVLIVRDIQAGWIVGQVPSGRKPRSFETWEIRIWSDGTVYEARGWKGADGVLERSRLSVSHVQDLVRSAESLQGLPDYVGRIATDIPYREIELAVNGQRRVITAFPSEKNPDPEVESFTRVWEAVATLFPERSVCRGPLN